MKQYVLLLLIVFLFKVSMGQVWHSADEKLKYRRVNPYYATIRCFDACDTLKCIYTINGSPVEYNGFKPVLFHNCHYIDTRKTFKVFYDDKMRRINNVEKYYFK